MAKVWKVWKHWVAVLKIKYEGWLEAERIVSVSDSVLSLVV
jgi:hypothetical protein